ncbi:unnamed protein product [Colletotrichum noveboracense]|uniref:Uncharacterized protein n=1 Tax=Colletotrichum noveboracense TaxID=2664923 RepID=A0A9W4RY16_9PEZI|nr:unnamed protein product [Colletotrichum noveboracense]
MKQTKTSRKRSNAVVEQTEIAPRPLPQLSVQTAPVREVIPTIPGHVVHQRSFSDQLDYQLWNMGQIINICRADRNTRFQDLSREREARSGLEQTMSRLQEELSSTTSKHLGLHDQYCLLGKKYDELQSSSNLVNAELHRELSAAKDLLERQRERIHACEMDLRQFQRKVDDQAQLVKTQEDIIKDLYARDQGRTPHFRDLVTLPKADFFSVSPKMEEELGQSREGNGGPEHVAKRQRSQ